ncbi:hypothetical protein GOP47_0023488 [Adiantum capillus-veneris]|uniref:Major facilitator superfamily (MFS) profile domain-containing protein n=1 Tax=Adiantum capillus-veneris TaxID=13818 RepID=A0A9D4Z3E9_ADICA|nr:hypothetical protein GOP47_0023488 [Adiantum capillus-veneris]
MSIVYLVALATTIGNMLQGWHGGAIAGALLYLKTDFNLEGKPEIEGIIVASAIITAFVTTLCAGPLADWLGRKAMLHVSGVLYTMGAAIMAWSPHVYVLIMGRFLIGIAVGLASAISPLHISECSPPEIRGQLLTFPQLCGSVGMLLAYSLAFGISLMSPQPPWRAMLGVTLVPSILYVVLCRWYIPESPRWLVSKGRMVEAKQVLQRLRKKNDVAAELALLVEGLGHDEVAIEEYILHPANAKNCDSIDHEGSHIQIIGADSEGASWIATPLASAHDGDGFKSPWSTAGSMRSDSQANQDSHKILPLDPLVAFIGSLQRSAPDGLHTSASFKDSEVFAPFDEENPPSYSPAIKDSNLDDGTSDDDLSTPLLEEKNESLLFGDPASPYSMRSSMGKQTPLSSFSNFLRGSIKSIRSDSLDHNNDISTSNDIGGGWQLAWKWLHEEGKVSDFKTVFLHQQPVFGDGVISHASSMASIVGRIGSEKNLVFQASSLVGTPAQSQVSLVAEGSIGPAMLHPVNTALRGPAWSDIMEPGVRGALVIGCMLQFLQQFSGLNAVLYYTPQILQASGAEGLLSNLSKDSTSLLASTISGILVIPFILWAVRLMDTSGRRAILLHTLPILPVCLILVILIKDCLPEGLLQASLSFVVMASFMCCFIMGFGPIPNILCAEIFPTRVRGLCNGICAATMWLSTVFITYCFPATVVKIGLDGHLQVPSNQW